MDSGSAVPTLNPGLRATVAEKLRTVARGRDGCAGAGAAGEGNAAPAGTAVATAPVAAFMLTRIARFLAADKADRKSTRLNSSHLGISYAVFCLKKKK